MCLSCISEDNVLYAYSLPGSLNVFTSPAERMYEVKCSVASNVFRYMCNCLFVSVFVNF